MTQAGLAIGTPAYMSPEQAGGEDIDGRSDIYSLGCVLYEMLSGEVPFTGPTPQAIMSKRFLSPVPHVKAMRDVPDGLDSVVTRSLARSPVDRFQTSAEFAAALRPATATHRTPPGAERSPPAAKAVAVLPLANMSADRRTSTQRGITRRSSVRCPRALLQVAAAPPAFAFKGRRSTSGGGREARGWDRSDRQRPQGRQPDPDTTQLGNVEIGYHLGRRPTTASSRMCSRSRIDFPGHRGGAQIGWPGYRRPGGGADQSTSRPTALSLKVASFANG